MKRSVIAVGLALVLALFAFVGCTPSQNSAPPVGEQPAPGTGGQAPAVSPLAVLDTVDVSAAFGDREAEGWSFALEANGDTTSAFVFSLTSEIGGREKLDTETNVRFGLHDLFGIRGGESAEDVELFGGGDASVLLSYRGPHEDSEEVSKDLSVGFRHDGEFVWFAGEGEDETAISLSELKEKADAAITAETLQRMEEAFAVIPEELKKGATLRFAVEKLIDLGFTVSIDDSDGIAVSLKANEGFYTDLFNDLLETAIPSEWLKYLPRVDFAYEKTVFDITLAFDSRGIFREYSMSRDVALTASLAVRGLFRCESGITIGGAFSLTASVQATPAAPSDPSETA